MKKIGKDGKARSVSNLKRRKINDHYARQLRIILNLIMNRLVKKYGNVFADPDAAFVDFSSTIYSTCELHDIKEALELGAEDLPGLCNLDECFRVSITQLTSAPLAKTDFLRISQNLDEYDACVLNFFNVATSHFVASRP